MHKLKNKYNRLLTVSAGFMKVNLRQRKLAIHQYGLKIQFLLYLHTEKVLIVSISNV